MDSCLQHTDQQWHPWRTVLQSRRRSYAEYRAHVGTTSQLRQYRYNRPSDIYANSIEWSHASRVEKSQRLTLNVMKSHARSCQCSAISLRTCLNPRFRLGPAVKP